KPGDRRDLRNLEGERSIAIGHDVKLGKAIREQDAVECFFEQIRSRSTEEVKAGFIDSPFEPRVRLIECDYEINFIALGLGERFLKILETEEQESRGKSKVFAQQPIAFEAMGG